MATDDRSVTAVLGEVEALQRALGRLELTATEVLPRVGGAERTRLAEALAVELLGIAVALELVHEVVAADAQRWMAPCDALADLFAAHRPRT